MTDMGEQNWNVYNVQTVIMWSTRLECQREQNCTTFKTDLIYVLIAVRVYGGALGTEIWVLEVHRTAKGLLQKLTVFVSNFYAIVTEIMKDIMENDRIGISSLVFYVSSP